MYRSYVLIVGLSICMLSVKAQNYCLVKINIEECLNCIVFAKQLTDISSDLTPKIVFPSWYEQDAEDLLEKGIGFRWPKKNMIFSDSLYEAFNTGVSSSIHIFNSSGKEIYKCFLLELENKLPIINSFTSINSSQRRNIKLDDSLVFSRQVNVIESEGVLYVHDYFYDNIRIISTTEGSLLYSIDGKSIDRKYLHEAIFDDLSNYELTLTYDSILTRYGKNHCKIESIWVEDDDLYSIVTLPYPRIKSSKGKNTLMIELEFLILKWEKGNILEVLQIANPKNKNYDIDQTNAFFRIGDEYFISIFKDDLKGKKYFMGVYSVNENRLEFNRFLKSEVPKFFVENNFVYDFFSYKYQNPFLFFSNTSEFLSVKTGTQYSLPIKESVINRKPTFLLLASHVDNEFIRVFYKEGSHYYLRFLDRSNGSFTHPILWPDFELKQFKGTPFFIDRNTIGLIEKDNSITILSL